MPKDTELQTIDEATTALAIPDLAAIREVIAANFGVGGISEFELDRIKVPAGGGTMWEIPTLAGPENVRYLEGTIVAWKDGRSYWQGAYDGSKNPPDCSSKDGKIGFGIPGGDCTVCPLAQFGTATDAKGNHTAGQACKMVRSLFMMDAARQLPYVVAVPPSSLKPIRQYFLRLAAAGVAFWGVETRLGLVKAQSLGGGITYSQIEPSMIVRYDGAVAQAWKATGEEFAPVAARFVVDAEAYAAN